jgi:hypothetical protein
MVFHRPPLLSCRGTDTCVNMSKRGSSNVSDADPAAEPAGRSKRQRTHWNYAVLAACDDEELEAARKEGEPPVAPSRQEVTADRKDRAYAPSPPPQPKRPVFNFNAAQAAAFVGEVLERKDVNCAADVHRELPRLDMARCTMLWQRVGTYFFLSRNHAQCVVCCSMEQASARCRGSCC